MDTTERFYDADLHQQTSENSHFEIFTMNTASDVTTTSLVVNALFVDTVQTQLGLMDEEQLDTISGEEEEDPNLVDFLLDHLRDRQINLDDSALEAFSQTLCAGLIDLDCSAEDDIEQHHADFHAFLAERCRDDTISTFAAAAKRASGQTIVKGETAHHYSTAAGRFCHGRVFFVTEDGRFGMGPPGTQKGDRCAVLFGARLPFALRPHRGDQVTTYSLLGEVYLHGFMRGEAVTSWWDGILAMNTISLA